MPRAVESASAEQVFVGALEGRSCCSGLEDVDVSPKLIINIYLSGSQSLLFDGIPIREGAATAKRPRVSMINVRRPARIHFENVDVGRLRKIKIAIPLDFVERELDGLSGGSPAVSRFFSTHLAHFSFDADPETIALAEQIMAPPANVRGELLKLYLMARGLEVMRLCCTQLLAHAGELDHQSSAITARQSERVRSYILANLTSELTIETIARETGASASSVQRHFKRHFGMTVFDFIRRKRLEAARDALETRGVTVAEAAWIAGYQSPSSFITAFKKAYGTCPGSMRS